MRSLNLEIAQQVDVLFGNEEDFSAALGYAVGAADEDLRGQADAGPAFEDLEILDRVGGGDSLASGLIFGLLEGLDVDTALAYGIAHGALAMTTPGDTSMATRAEVERLVGGRAPRVDR